MEEKRYQIDNRKNTGQRQSYDRETSEWMRRREAMRKKRKRQKIRRLALIGILAVLLIAVVIVVIAKTTGKDRTSEKSAGIADIRVAMADRLAASYCYDDAIKLLESAADDAASGNDASQTEIENAIKKHKAAQDACVAVDVNTVPHVFFHSLLNDTRGFDPDLVGDFVANDNGCWMCTADEFKAIMQQMHDAGYVLIRLHDLVKTEVDANGVPHFTPNDELKLPPDKKPFIMSQDDVSYYHSYDGQGYASKLIIDENGEVKCEYINENGETLVGDYDLIPILDSFIRKNPDFSYRGAKAAIALTGYNGVLGYRTDSVYQTRNPDDLDAAQQAFLDSNPDFNFEDEVARAREVAEAIKEDGYEFASHTWGHLHADTASVDWLATDTEQWISTVPPIIGETDIMIYSHGGDIGNSAPYDETNEKYNVLKNAGFRFFCNVDATVPYWIQISENAVRTARINLDGYSLYTAMSDPDSNRAKLAEFLGIHDIDSFFDPDRITPVVIP